MVTGPTVVARKRLSTPRSRQRVMVVAARLHLAEGTVRNHLSSPIQKLGAPAGG